MPAKMSTVLKANEPKPTERRVGEYDWATIGGDLDIFGCAVLKSLLTASECDDIGALYPREEHFRIPSHHSGRSLFLRYLPPPAPTLDNRDRLVLYVHGGTFPSGLSIAHRFDGRSWRDELCAAGFHVWAVDFHGFGRLSDAYSEMERPAEQTPPLGLSFHRRPYW